MKTTMKKLFVLAALCGVSLGAGAAGESFEEVAKRRLISGSDDENFGTATEGWSDAQKDLLKAVVDEEYGKYSVEKLPPNLGAINYVTKYSSKGDRPVSIYLKEASSPHCAPCDRRVGGQQACAAPQISPWIFVDLFHKVPLRQAKDQQVSGVVNAERAVAAGLSAARGVLLKREQDKDSIDDETTRAYYQGTDGKVLFDGLSASRGKGSGEISPWVKAIREGKIDIADLNATNFMLTPEGKLVNIDTEDIHRAWEPTSFPVQRLIQRMYGPQKEYEALMRLRTSLCIIDEGGVGEGCVPKALGFEDLKDPNARKVMGEIMQDLKPRIFKRALVPVVRLSIAYLTHNASSYLIRVKRAYNSLISLMKKGASSSQFSELLGTDKAFKGQSWLVDKVVAEKWDSFALSVSSKTTLSAFSSACSVSRGMPLRRLLSWYGALGVDTVDIQLVISALALIPSSFSVNFKKLPGVFSDEEQKVVREKLDELLLAVRKDVPGSWVINAAKRFKAWLGAKVKGLKKRPILEDEGPLVAE